MKLIISVFVTAILIGSGANKSFGCSHMGEKTILNAERGFGLCGELLEIVIAQKNGVTEKITGIFELKIKNNSPKSLILLPDYLSVLGAEAKTDKGEVISNYGNYGSPRFNDLKKVKQSLDKPSPTGNEIQIVEPKEYWTFLREVNLELDRPIVNPVASWNLLKGNSPVHVSIKLQVVDARMIKDGRPTDAMRFWKSLKNRWSKYGNLLIDPIVTMPVLVDLDLTTIRFTEAG